MRRIENTLDDILKINRSYTYSFHTNWVWKEQLMFNIKVK
jgi:hypothetical protein